MVMVQSQLRNGEKHHFILLVLDFASHTDLIPLVFAQAKSCPVSSYSLTSDG